MRYAAGFARFWWDFVVGDDWRIAAGVTASLAAGALLVSVTALPDAAISLLTLAGVVLTVAATVVLRGRRGAR